MIASVSNTTVMRCGACEDHGLPPLLVAFEVTTEVGAISVHRCGATVEWTGVPPNYTKALSDPDDWKGYLVLAILIFPTIIGFLVGGLGGALVGFVAGVVLLFIIRGLHDAFDGRFTWWIGWWW